MLFKRIQNDQYQPEYKFKYELIFPYKKINFTKIDLSVSEFSVKNTKTLGIDITIVTFFSHFWYSKSIVEYGIKTYLNEDQIAEYFKKEFE